MLGNMYKVSKQSQSKAGTEILHLLSPNLFIILCCFGIRYCQRRREGWNVPERYYGDIKGVDEGRRRSQRQHPGFHSMRPGSSLCCYCPQWRCKGGTGWPVG